LREERFEAAQMDDCETKVLNVARQHRFRKQVQQGTTLIAGLGIEDDTHACGDRCLNIAYPSWELMEVKSANDRPRAASD
jgi:hypothetical protein